MLYTSGRPGRKVTSQYKVNEFVNNFDNFNICCDTFYSRTYLAEFCQVKNSLNSTPPHKQRQCAQNSLYFDQVRSVLTPARVPSVSDPVSTAGPSPSSSSLRCTPTSSRSTLSSSWTGKPMGYTFFLFYFFSDRLDSEMLPADAMPFFNCVSKPHR